MRSQVLLAAAVALAIAPAMGVAQSLRGSSASLDIQNEMARAQDFTYLETEGQLERFVKAGYLVKARPNKDFDLHAVSFPYARPSTLLFVRRLASQYHAACGEKLVVTSLTRPESDQPPNASDRSVHPTGMAVDLRYPRNLKCRRWMERVLLDLEGAQLIEATRERHPAHYHVAVFPDDYRSYAAAHGAVLAVDRSSRASLEAEPGAQNEDAPRNVVHYKVRRGDSLWGIARAHGVSVAALREQNDLDSSAIRAGQILDIPAPASH